MSDKIKATLIHNPTAGDGAHDADDLTSILADAGFQVRYQSTKKDWKKAMSEPTDMFVAAGGDGTLSKVMRAARGMETPVALLPLGTANNIGRSFKVLGEVHELVRAWSDAEPQEIDLGVAEWDQQSAIFVEGCGGGLFAAAIEEGREKIEEGAFFLGHEIDRALIFLLKHLEERGRPVRWAVEVDGADSSGEYFSVEVLNIRFAGPSVPLAPEADMADGVFEVVLIGEAEREALIDYLNSRIDHAAAELPELTRLRGRDIRLAPAKGPFRVDDELAVDGNGRRKPKEFRIGVERAAVRVIAPGAAD